MGALGGGGEGVGGGGMDATPAFTVSRGELGELVRAAVRAELGARQLLVDKQQLSRQLGCSPAHVDHLRKRGLPTLMVGQMVRFEPDAVLGWLREQAPHNDQE